MIGTDAVMLLKIALKKEGRISAALLVCLVLLNDMERTTVIR